jgi:hypothetical protein
MRDNMERRRLAPYGGINPVEALIARLDEMAERLRDAPDWREPSPEEAAADGRGEVLAWLDARARRDEPRHRF